MLLPILTYPHGLLREEAAKVTEITPDIRTLAMDMADTMYDAPGRGLAAPQVGQLLRLFIMDVGWRDGFERAPRFFVNPEVIEFIGPKIRGPEACLSIPGREGQVRRAAEVVLSWTNLEGARREGRFSGFEAVCVQHELDHLDGVLWIDRVEPSEEVHSS
ncbi:MAG: peptide deformylase [Pseudomonadota bacterium]